jgi:hypothetical protein
MGASQTNVAQILVNAVIGQVLRNLSDFATHQELSGETAQQKGKGLEHPEVYLDAYLSRNRFTAAGGGLESPAPHCLHRRIIERLIY